MCDVAYCTSSRWWYAMSYRCGVLYVVTLVICNVIPPDYYSFPKSTLFLTLHSDHTRRMSCFRWWQHLFPSTKHTINASIRHQGLSLLRRPGTSYFLRFYNTVRTISQETWNQAQAEFLIQGAPENTFSYVALSYFGPREYVFLGAGSTQAFSRTHDDRFNYSIY